MRKLFDILCLIILVGCSSHKKEQGPLSQFNEFHVTTCISPYENYDREKLLSFSLKSLRSIGEIKIAKNNESPSTPILLLSLGGSQEKSSGSIQVISDAKIVKNGVDIACSIWKMDYLGNNPSYPLVEDEKIFFKKKDEKIRDNSPDSTIKFLIDEFFEEYKKNNPEGKTPIFYINNANPGST